MPRNRTTFELYRHFCSTLLSDGGSSNPLRCVWESRRGGDTSLCGSAFDYGLDLLVETRFTCSRNDVNCGRERRPTLIYIFQAKSNRCHGDLSSFRNSIYFFVFEPLASTCIIFRILGVIGSQSSHWSGRLIRSPDKDKDVVHV